MASKDRRSIVGIDISSDVSNEALGHAGAREAIAPTSSRSVPILMIAMFCAILGGVLVIAVIDMVSPGREPAAGERAPSWPAR